MSDHGPIVNKGEDFVYQGKAYRAEAAPFDAGGSVGRAVLARRLEWVSAEMVGATWVSSHAQAYGATEPIPCGGLLSVDFEDGSAFSPEDSYGERYGLFDRPGGE